MNQEPCSKRTRARTPNNRTTTGFRVSDALWAVLEPLLPVRVNAHRFGGGRPRQPDRACADALFSVLGTGGPWQALDQTEGAAHSTAHDRFQAGVEAGVFLGLWRAGIERFDELQGDRLGRAELGRGDDQGPAGRGKKPAPTRRIAARPESSAAC